MLRKILIALAAVFVLAQLVPVARTNPPVTQRLEAPGPVLAILERSCRDCHSHETEWPWYAYVAPVSWILADHVEEGRSKLNFSAWDYPEDKARHKISEMLEEVEEGEMPLKGYVVLHADAKLSPADLEVIRAWVAVAGEVDGEEDAGEAEHEGGTSDKSG